MQRIFKYGGIQNIILTPDKELNILIIDCLPKSLYKKVMHFKKWSGFLAHPVVYIGSSRETNQLF